MSEQSKHPLISVIVPVYNVEKYLERCVKSILLQTYDRLEIILVNDGSKDGSGKLCDELAKGDPRIVVLHKENGGASSARNAGLDLAHGEYIGFVDSDDWIAPDMYEYCLRAIDAHDAQVVQTECALVRSEAEAVKQEPEQVEDTVADEVYLREEDIKFAYCTEYIVTVDETATKHNPAELRSYLESIGDSVVCVPDNDITSAFRITLCAILDGTPRKVLCHFNAEGFRILIGVFE